MLRADVRGETQIRRIEERTEGGEQGERAPTGSCSNTLRKSSLVLAFADSNVPDRLRFASARVAGTTKELEETEQQPMSGEECRAQAVRETDWRAGEKSFRSGQQLWRDGEGSG